MSDHHAGVRHLQRWVDIDPWPWIKLRAARAEIDALRADVDIWNLEYPTRAHGSVSPDGRIISFKIASIPPSPLLSWSARYGDVMSSLRRALDSITWQIAHLDDGAPRRPKSLYFPAPRESSERWWSDWFANLPDMSDELRARFKYVFRDDPSSLSDALLRLARANNVDKHQGALTISPRGAGASLFSTLDLGGTRSEPTQMIVKNLLPAGAEVVEGTPLCEFEWDYQFAGVDGMGVIPLVPWTDLSHEAERAFPVPVLEALEYTHAVVAQVLEFLCDGEVDRVDQIPNLSDHIDA